MIHCMDAEGNDDTTDANGINDKWETLHLALFQSRPMHYAATGGHYLGATVVAVNEHDDGLLVGGSPEYLALVQMYDEHVKTMCASMFLDNRYNHQSVQSQVVDSVTTMLGMDGRLSTAHTTELQSKARDTATTQLLRLELNKMMLYTVTQAVINRSQEEKMERWLGSKLLRCGEGWTWGHHRHLVWVKSKLTKPWFYSEESPVDLMRLLGNADRHCARFYLHVTPLKALLDMYPPLHRLTASLLPHLNEDEIGVNDQQRAAAARHLEDNPSWDSFFYVGGSGTGSVRPRYHLL